jgi:L-amino acid N-acyltransferase
MNDLFPVSLRLATQDDLFVINEIYNYYVLHSTCTYQLKPEPIAGRRRWFAEHSADKYPIIVAESSGNSGGEVVGWGSLSRFHPRAGYDPTVEASVYIHADHHRQGVGRAILVDLIDRARRAGFHSIIGGASADQTASIALQEALGFQRRGQLVEVGIKFGRRLDVVYLQLMLDPESGRA